MGRAEGLAHDCLMKSTYTLVTKPNNFCHLILYKVLPAL